MTDQDSQPLEPETSTADQLQRPPAVPLLEPSDGLPPLVTSADALLAAS